MCAERADGGDLLAAGQIARAGEFAGLDGVAQDHVQARLGGRRADRRSPAHVEVALGHPHAPQDVLLRRHELDRRQRGLVVPREVRVGLGHARHQELALAVDDAGAVGADALRCVHDIDDPLAVDKQLALEDGFAAAVEDIDVGDGNF